MQNERACGYLINTHAQYDGTKKFWFKINRKKDQTGFTPLQRSVMFSREVVKFVCQITKRELAPFYDIRTSTHTTTKSFAEKTLLY